MKKIYEEPMIVVEQYALTQNIAACADMSDQVKDLIAAGYSADEIQGIIESLGGDNNTLCYHTNANNAFGS